MKTPNSRALAVCIAGSALVSPAVVAAPGLFEYALNRDGVINTVLPPGNTFDTTTGLGALTLTFDTAGPHYGGVFVDHELSETVNTFFNETGATSGVPLPAGLSFEIDEPGFAPTPGDIFPNFTASALDNGIGTPSTVFPDDVAMALAWSFNLAAGETAALDFIVSLNPLAGFYLIQTDPDSDEVLYFGTQLTIRGTPPPNGEIPEPGTVAGGLALAVLAGGFLARRFRR